MDREFPIDNDSRLGELVKRAEDGEAIAFTREGKVVARIVPDAVVHDKATSAAAMARLLELGKTIHLGNGLKFADLVREGRKY